ncbi:hypothetical protein HBA54_03200 [Pelagibius litoralis]|uniref:Lipoprotein n=1 Tax=Pelagibius litoralis TaxID=374515 RepID=A0A967CAQ2_9PROT|nr:hypothetical protein [Pelagibius litoralis]NIA67589.1 hypothetical protein [Pelagibius litoralis]
MIKPFHFLVLLACLGLGACAMTTSEPWDTAEGEFGNCGDNPDCGS